MGTCSGQITVAADSVGLAKTADISTQTSGIVGTGSKTLTNLDTDIQAVTSELNALAGSSTLAAIVSSVNTLAGSSTIATLATALNTVNSNLTSVGNTLSSLLAALQAQNGSLPAGAIAPWAGFVGGVESSPNTVAYIDMAAYVGRYNYCTGFTVYTNGPSTNEFSMGIQQNRLGSMLVLGLFAAPVNLVAGQTLAFNFPSPIRTSNTNMMLSLAITPAGSGVTTFGQMFGYTL